MAGKTPDDVDESRTRTAAARKSLFRCRAEAGDADEGDKEAELESGREEDDANGKENDNSLSLREGADWEIESLRPDNSGAERRMGKNEGRAPKQRKYQRAAHRRVHKSLKTK